MLSSFVKASLHFGGALTVLRLASVKSRALIVRYHSVAEPLDRAELYLADSLSISPRVFEQQVRFFLGHYRLVSLDHIVESLSEGTPLHPRALAITFDDGYRDNYTRAFPILHRYRAPATFYLTTGCIDNKQILWTAHLRYLLRATRKSELRLTQPKELFFDLSRAERREAAFTALVILMKNISTQERLELLKILGAKLPVNDTSPLKRMMMTWNEVRIMRSEGMSFGAHTVTHPNLPNTEEKEAEREILQSKTMIEEQLQEPVLHFSYPNGRGSGHLTDEVRHLVCRIGFKSAVTSLGGCIENGDDPYALKRLGVYKRHSRVSDLSWEIEKARWQRAEV